MCGLLGFFTEAPSEGHAEDFKALLNYMEIRGVDATGVLVHRPWRKRGTGRWKLLKQAIKPTRFTEETLPELMPDIAKSHLVIGHVRAKTIGSSNKPENNHPVEGDKYMVTHNGSVSSTDKVKGYKYKGEVDTELIVAQLENKGLEGLKEVVGTAACIFTDTTKEPPILYIWAHNQTMYIGTTGSPRTIWWSSTEDGLDVVANKLDGLFYDMAYVKVPEDELFSLSLKKGRTIKVSALGEMKGKRGSCYYGSGNYSNYRGNTQGKEDTGSKPIEPLSVHHLDLEEGVEDVYGWDIKEERFVLDEEVVKDNRVVPYLGTEMLKNVKYVSPVGSKNDDMKWPQEYFSFDPHNFRVVNRALGIQMLTIALNMSVQGE